jgi:SH3-like domain-containing protein
LSMDYPAPLRSVSEEVEMNASTRTLVLVVLVLGILTACSMGSAPPTAAPTGTPQPPTATPAPPTETPLPTATPTPIYTPVAAQVTVFSLNLRNAPSTVATSGGFYNAGSNVTVLGKAPGEEWVQVKTSDGKTGWMYASFLDLKNKLATVPVIAVGDAISVLGKVTDASGNGIAGVDVAVTQQSSGKTLRTDAISTRDGSFYAYLPAGSTGTWTVQIVGVDCTSPIIEANCAYSGKFDQGGKITADLAQLQPIVFVYRK